MTIIPYSKCCEQSAPLFASLDLTVPHFPSHQGARPELPVTALNIICILSKFHHTSIMKAVNDERSQACIILSENRRTKTGGSLGTRLIIWRLYSPWLSLFPPPYLNRLFVLCFQSFVSHSKVQWHHIVKTFGLL